MAHALARRLQQVRRAARALIYFDVEVVRRPVSMLGEPLDVGMARNVVAVRRLINFLVEGHVAAHDHGHVVPRAVREHLNGVAHPLARAAGTQHKISGLQRVDARAHDVGIRAQVRAPALVGRRALRQRRHHGVVRLGVQACQRFAHHSHASEAGGIHVSRRLLLQRSCRHRSMRWLEDSCNYFLAAWGSLGQPRVHAAAPNEPELIAN